MSFEVKYAERVGQLPVYLFIKLENMRNKALSEGKDVINLGVGDPDIPTPDFIVKKMQQAVTRPQNHVYPSNYGTMDFREAAVAWMKRRFGVELDAASEVMSIIGSKEGLGHLPFAYINPGDVSLIPSLAYPVYNNCTILAGGEVHRMPLTRENHFIPDLEAIPLDVRKKAKLLFINYPNNPTAAVADKEFFKKVVAFAREYNIIVCHDAAYSEMTFDGYRPPSFLEVEGAKDVAIEFHSLSKTFRMTGWRIGFVAGNAEIIKGLFKIKSNIDSGAFGAIQEAAIEAMEDGDAAIKELTEVYGQRRDVFVQGLQKLGWQVESPKATFYVWARPPGDVDDELAVEKLISEAYIVAAPGSGYGEDGRGFIRFALTVPIPRLEEALKRLESISF